METLEAADSPVAPAHPFVKAADPPERTPEPRRRRLAIPLNAGRSIFALARRRVPGQLVIQFTDKCNARCPQCGMNIRHEFPRSTIAMDDLKRTIDAAAEKGFRVLSFTGGEPLLFLDALVELIHYAGRAGMDFIRTGTNGFVFANPNGHGFDSRVKRVAEALAGSPLRNFWISIDSAEPAVHEKMRGFPGLIEGVERALPIFHGMGLYPSANLGINRNMAGEAAGCLKNGPSPCDRDDLEVLLEDFRLAFRKFYRFVIQMGFTMVNTCYPMSVDDEPDEDSLSPVYAATSDDLMVMFDAAERVALFQALLETIPEFRSQIRIFSPLTSLYALNRQYKQGPEGAYPCRGGIDFLFVNASDGDTYPCGYRGHENLGKFWSLNPRRLNTKHECYQCDWECFRDPSELFGPILDGVSKPVTLIRKFRNDEAYFRLWLNDLLYYRACRFFDGRRPPDMARLKRFAPRPAP